VGTGTTRFTVGERLQVVVDASKASMSMYQFELVPKQGKITGNATDPVSLNQPGSFSLDLAYTPPDGPSVDARRCFKFQQSMSSLHARATSSRPPSCSGTAAHVAPRRRFGRV
jgi:hypothetical protein